MANAHIGKIGESYLIEKIRSLRSQLSSLIKRLESSDAETAEVSAELRAVAVVAEVMADSIKPA